MNSFEAAQLIAVSLVILSGIGGAFMLFGKTKSKVEENRKDIESHSKRLKAVEATVNRIDTTVQVNAAHSESIKASLRRVEAVNERILNELLSGREVTSG